MPLLNDDLLFVHIPRTGGLSIYYHPEIDLPGQIRRRFCCLKSFLLGFYHFYRTWMQSWFSLQIFTMEFLLPCCWSVTLCLLGHNYLFLIPFCFAIFNLVATSIPGNVHFWLCRWWVEIQVFLLKMWDDDIVIGNLRQHELADNIFEMHPEYRNITSFCIIRCPIERAISMYNYCRFPFETFKCFLDLCEREVRAYEDYRKDNPGPEPYLLTERSVFVLPQYAFYTVQDGDEKQSIVTHVIRDTEIRSNTISEDVREDVRRIIYTRPRVNAVKFRCLTGRKGIITKETLEQDTIDRIRRIYHVDVELYSNTSASTKTTIQIRTQRL